MAHSNETVVKQYFKTSTGTKNSTTDNSPERVNTSSEHTLHYIHNTAIAGSVLDWQVPEPLTAQLNDDLADEYKHICAQISALQLRVGSFVKKMGAEQLSHTSSNCETIDNVLATLNAKLSALTQHAQTSYLSSAKHIDSSKINDIAARHSKGAERGEYAQPDTPATPSFRHVHASRANRISIFEQSARATHPAHKQHGVALHKSAVQPQTTQLSPRKSAKLCTTEELRTDSPRALKAPRANRFDTILQLLRMNFIDREQSVHLKKKVVCRDEVVTRALVAFEASRDLKVLIHELRHVLDEAYVN